MRWASCVNVGLGVWLVCAPWALDYVSATASDNDVWVGALVTVLGINSAAVARAGAPAFINLTLGIWLLIAPWILAYPPAAAVATVNDTVAGSLIITFGAVRIWGAHRGTGKVSSPVSR